MGTVTNLLRCQGEEAFLSFCERNLARINERQQFHLDDKTTYSLAGKDEREKVLFEYAIGEIYLEQLPADAQQGVKDTAEMMHRKLRSWFRTGAIAGGAAVGIAMLIGSQLIRSGPARLSTEQIKLECARYESEASAAYRKYQITYQGQMDDFLGPVNDKYRAVLETPDPKSFCHSLAGFAAD